MINISIKLSVYKQRFKRMNNNILIFVLILSSCKTITVQRSTNYINYSVTYPLPSTLSKFDTLPIGFVYPEPLSSIVSNLPTNLSVIGKRPNVNVKGIQGIGKSSIVLGDSNVVSKKVENKKVNKESNNTGLVWIGIAAVVAVLLFFLIKK